MGNVGKAERAVFWSCSVLLWATLITWIAYSLTGH
jgi:hypothetical protein